jgi:uncharacterized protein (TIRG00374 family)
VKLGLDGQRVPDPAAGAWKRRAATFVSLLISTVLLGVLYRTLDARQIARTLLGADPVWLIASVGAIVPITLLRAVRFYWVAPRGTLPSLAEALRLTLVASALNVFVPAKGGDLVKSYFIARRGQTPPGVAIAVAVYERLCDLVGLITCCLAAWLLARPVVPGVAGRFWVVLAGVGAASAMLILSPRAARVLQTMAERVLVHRALRRVREIAPGWPALLDMLRGRRRWVVFYSVGLWCSHLVQIWMFTIALGVSVSFGVCASLSAVALMVGQLPFTVAGLGTRDLALVLLLAPYMAPESAAAMGVLIATRGLLPPLLGLPLMWPYVSSALADAPPWRREIEQAE